MTTNARKPFGQHGEQLAVEHLQQQGYTVVGVNWRCNHGEIDVIAQHNDTLVFVEVRTRHASSPETAFESITPRKRKKLAALAHTYLSLHNLEQVNWRVDVIAIALPPSGQPIIEQAEDALGW
jgi:putative endonuclease